MFTYMGDDRIDDTKEHGVHIDLTCKNHPDLRWNTKNIGFIGARTIFYKSWEKPECNCSADDLIVVKE